MEHCGRAISCRTKRRIAPTKLLEVAGDAVLTPRYSYKKKRHSAMILQLINLFLTNLEGKITLEQNNHARFMLYAM